MIEAKTHANGKKFTLEANDVNGDGVINIDDLQWETSGLKVYARLDPGEYEKGIKVSDAELAAVNITRHDFHPDWNYTIHPTDTAVNNSGAPVVLVEVIAAVG